MLHGYSNMEVLLALLILYFHHYTPTIWLQQHGGPTRFTYSLLSPLHSHYMVTVTWRSYLLYLFFTFIITLPLYGYNNMEVLLALLILYFHHYTQTTWLQ